MDGSTLHLPRPLPHTRPLPAPHVPQIFVCSVAGYYAVTWAMRHLPASQVGWLGVVLLHVCLQHNRALMPTCRAATPATAPALPVSPPASAPPPLSLEQVAAFQCLQPFIGTLLAFLVLNESPTPWDLGAVSWGLLSCAVGTALGCR